jgi:hypothetical protein
VGRWLCAFVLGAVGLVSCGALVASGPAEAALAGRGEPGEMIGAGSAEAGLANGAIARIRSRYADRPGWLAAWRLAEMEPWPLVTVSRRFPFETLTFGIRLFQPTDYRFTRPREIAVTLDDGLRVPADDSRLYCAPEPGLAVVALAPDVLAVVSQSLPPAARPYRATRIPRPQPPAPPDVVLGTLDAQGELIPAVPLPSVQAGFRFLLDPFSGSMVRVGRGALFPAPPAPSGRARTLSSRDLVLRDAAGRPMPGAFLDAGDLPGEAGPVLVMEHAGERLAVGAAGPREREIHRRLAALPGEPVGVDSVQFPVATFRATLLALEPAGARLKRAIPSTGARARRR